MKISILNNHLYEEVYNGHLMFSVGLNPGLIGADLVNGSPQDNKVMISFNKEELAQIKEWASKINVR